MTLPAPLQSQISNLQSLPLRSRVSPSPLRPPLPPGEGRGEGSLASLPTLHGFPPPPLQFPRPRTSRSLREAIWSRSSRHLHTSTPPHLHRFSPLLVLFFSLLLLPACVTERVTPPRPTTPVPARTPPPPPPGPVAPPADPSATSVSHITVAIKPLGAIPYDGLSLPLTSPDGRFIAVQQGLAPSWDALLGLPDADPPLGARIALYRITDDVTLEPLPSSPAPDGLLLGRSADDSGFLVESPRPNGARWIGFVPWSDPTAVRWLVQSDHLSSHAILTPRGRLLFARRPVGGSGGGWGNRGSGGEPSLVLRDGDAEFSAPVPDAHFLLPLAGAHPDDLAVLIASPNGLEIAPVSLPTTGEPPNLVIGPRRRLGALASPAAAYQSVAPLQIPLPAPASFPPAIPFFWHARQRMALFFPHNSTILPLRADSVAAVPAVLDAAGAGHLVAVPRGLVFQPFVDAGLASPNTTRSDHAISLVSGAYLPRITSRPGYVLLFGQSPNVGRPLYEVSVVVLGVPADR